MDTGKAFCDFINSCPTPYHFGHYVKEHLNEKGFQELDETKEWNLKNLPSKGFILRDNKGLIAFQLPSSYYDHVEDKNFPPALIIGTHSDSPTFKILPNFNQTDENLNEILVSPYGGAQSYTWYDRDLKCAGLIFYRKGESIESCLFDSIEPIGTIPSSVDDNPTSPSKIPHEVRIICGSSNSPKLSTYIANKLGINEDDIINYDLSFFDAQPASLVGFHDEFVATQRIDNLGSTYAALTAFLASSAKSSVNIFCCFDNEEIGSLTREGADSTFLSDFLCKLYGGKDILAKVVPISLFVSSDNAHAVHPGWVKIHEEMHQPIMGNGLTVKQSPKWFYATDIESIFPIRAAAGAAGCNLQEIINRNDVRGGTTIGPITVNQTGLLTVDVGLPQLAMHSIRETVAMKDIDESIKIFEEIYNNFEKYKMNLE